MRPGDLFWTDATIAQLKSLWDQGFSAGEIGRALNVPGDNHGRSAVIGKIHRLKQAGWVPVRKDFRAQFVSQPKKPRGRPPKEKPVAEPSAATSVEREEPPPHSPPFPLDFRNRRLPAEKTSGRHIQVKPAVDPKRAFQREESMAEEHRHRVCTVCKSPVPAGRAMLRCDACVAELVGTDRPRI